MPLLYPGIKMLSAKRKHLQCESQHFHSNLENGCLGNWPISVRLSENAVAFSIRERGSVLYLGMATEILNLP